MTLEEAQYEAVLKELESVRKHREFIELNLTHQSAQIERQTAALESIADSLRVLNRGKGFR